MEQNETEEKLCTNCKHFIQHYTILRGKLKTSCCGHCRKLNLKPNQITKRIIDKTPCNSWEREKRKEEAKQTFRKEVTYVKNLLEDIYRALQFDE